MNAKIIKVSELGTACWLSRRFSGTSVCEKHERCSVKDCKARVFTMQKDIEHAKEKIKKYRKRIIENSSKIEKLKEKVTQEERR